MLEKRPFVGVGVIVKKKGTILLGKRKNSHGAGGWQFPGGHLEYSESILDCARREVAEETGLQIANLATGPYTNDFFVKEKKHYITLYVTADWISGKPQVMEPDKCEQWGWFKWSELPKPLFLPVVHLLEQNYAPF